MCKINGKKLGELRTKAGVSQKELAKELGMSVSTVQNYEYGKSEPSTVLSVKLDAPAPCRLDAPDLDLICYASADCLHQHLQVI